MKNHVATRIPVHAFLLIVLALIFDARAQTVTQTFQLRNGWNSIWLEVEPNDVSMSAVFGGLPLSSVWSYAPVTTEVEFVQNQTEDIFSRSSWQRYFPAARPEAVFNNLTEARALRPYLIKTTAAATLNVTGRPVVRAAKWVSDALNLRGFPVNPANLPTFATFFGPSAAHAGQAVYQISDAGVWTQVAASDFMKHGEAYWVFCSGPSTFQGPLGLEFIPGDGLDYGTSATELPSHLKNNSPSARSVCFVPGAGNPLSYQVLANNRLSWVDLPSPHCLSLGGNEATDFHLAMRRAAFAGTSYGSVMEVKDDIGTRYLVAVTAQKLEAARDDLNSPPGAAGPNNLKAGLWAGTVSVNSVNEVNSLTPAASTPTRSAFDLRILIHVDGGGRARLLKEVLQMWQDGTSKPNPDGRRVVDKKGRFVLLTSDAMISHFKGATFRDGVPVGRRFSTVDFDFTGGAQNTLEMTGSFGIGGRINGRLTLDANAPNNPFKHKYHPDHDNLDATFQQARSEAYRVVRDVQLEFVAQPSSTATVGSLDHGYSVLGGNYSETVTGLHKRPIIARGAFRLTRISNTPALNQ